MTYEANIHNVRDDIESFMNTMGLTKESVQICYICSHSTWYQIDFDELMKAAERSNLLCYNGSYQFIIFFENGYRISLLNNEDGQGMTLKTSTEMIIRGNIHEYQDIVLNDLITESGKDFYLKEIRNLANELSKNFPDEIKESIREELINYFMDKFHL